MEAEEYNEMKDHYDSIRNVIPDFDQRVFNSIEDTIAAPTNEQLNDFLVELKKWGLVITNYEEVKAYKNAGVVIVGNTTADIVEAVSRMRNIRHNIGMISTAEIVSLGARISLEQLGKSMAMDIDKQMMDSIGIQTFPFKAPVHKWDIVELEMVAKTEADLEPPIHARNAEPWKRPTQKKTRKNQIDKRLKNRKGRK